MRVSLVLVLAFTTCGISHAKDNPEPAADGDGVTVNMDALTDEAPLPKPDQSKLAVWPLAKPEMANRLVTIPMPRPKPVMAKPVTEFSPAALAVVPVTQAPSPVAKAPAKAEVPVTIVENFPVEMTGAATDPFASTKPFNPVAGFSVLSRIRFSSGLSRMPSAAYAILDVVAQRLLASQERIRLAAFSGKTGDMSSESHRLSLERARVVREYLVSKGVAMDRVDVLPFGGATDGINDRVDVLASGT